MMKVSDTKNNIAKFEDVILRPRVTEKASLNAEENVYVFDVAPRANKVQIKEAIKAIYKVNPIKVNITAVTSKEVMSRGKKGVRPGGKKALVFLKKEDKIEII